MQRIKLDINPKGETPVLYVSQYDNGREFVIELVEGEEAYNVPSGYSVQLNVRKTDSKLVTKAPETIVDNIITFTTTEQMTACPGENIASISLKDTNDIVITTLYFLISVQRDVLAGGLDSASEIHDLEQQIAAIVPEVIGNDYYNKSQTDALLNDKANVSDLPDMSNYYTKSETNGHISALANYVDNKFNDIMPVGSATGNPCTFDTEYPYIIRGLKSEIVSSGGNGTPDNPIPIVGHSALNLDVNGNTFTVQFGQTVYGGVYDKSGRLPITHTLLTFNGSENWTTRQSGVGTIYELHITEAIKAEMESISNMYVWEMNLTSNNTFRILASGNVKVIAIHDDNRTDLATFKTFLSNNNLIICVELATPIVIDVRPINFVTKDGTNNITSDCIGDVTAYYKDSIQHYIDQRLQ